MQWFRSASCFFSDLWFGSEEEWYQFVSWPFRLVEITIHTRFSRLLHICWHFNHLNSYHRPGMYIKMLYADFLPTPSTNYQHSSIYSQALSYSVIHEKVNKTFYCLLTCETSAKNYIQYSILTWTNTQIHSNTHNNTQLKYIK